MAEFRMADGAPAEMEATADATWDGKNVYAILLTLNGGAIALGHPLGATGAMSPAAAVRLTSSEPLVCTAIRPPPPPPPPDPYRFISWLLPHSSWKCRARAPLLPPVASIRPDPDTDDETTSTDPPEPPPPPLSGWVVLPRPP